MIGIIGAMDIEVEGLISAMSNEEEKKISGIVFHSGKIGDKECVVAKCGVGKVNAAVCTQTMILEYQPECIINTGIGGATSQQCFFFIMANTIKFLAIKPFQKKLFPPVKAVA